MMINFLRAFCVFFFAAIIGSNAFANNHYPPLHLAAMNGNIAEIKRLIDDGADVNAKTEYGQTPLHFAAVNGHTETALALIKAGADINAKQKDGWTPLHFAARQGHTETALALIKAGADINAKQKDGWTPLHVAANEGQTEIALALIKAGADINAKSNDGWTPLHYAAREGQTKTALALIKAGADINAKQENGWTPLHIAAQEGQTEFAFALIKAGADINAKQKDGWTPLHIAALNGQTETALALIKVGADINAKNKYGWTPLHGAAFNGQTETALALIKAGAYIHATDESGRTPLQLARQFKQWNVVAILENFPKPKGESPPNVATSPVPDNSSVAERVFEKAWRSIVFIQTSGDKIGGGVIILPNIVATNCHVIDSGIIRVYKARNHRTDKSVYYRATIRHVDRRNDLCLLDVAGIGGAPMNIRRLNALRIGESVYSIGSPDGWDLSLSAGIISQKRRVSGVNYIQTDVAISPGSSGGGLFDRDGNLIGIITAKIIDYSVEGIGFAIPADLML